MSGFSKVTQHVLFSFTCESYRSILQVHQKKFMHLVRAGNVTKVSQALAKGLDPNFQDPETKG